MNLVLGVDPSWSGLGWCLALNERPLVAGYERLSKPWREVKLALPSRAQTRECASHLVPRSRAVVTRADFAALAPESLVKFHMHCAGVDPAEEEPGQGRRIRRR